MALPDEVIAKAASRIAEHAAAHRLPIVQVVLHGGEPLLAGAARLQRVITELQSALRGVCPLDLRIHTNGVQLDQKFCELFAEHDVKIGISLDGDQVANDRHRRYADGRSSFGKVLRAIELLRTARFRNLYAGLLCTIDVANDPLAVYQALADLDPPLIDFLLPHATWDHPPARPRGTESDSSDSDYASWLIAIFDRWIADGRPIRIRTFESIISTLHGGASLTEALGLGPSNLVVIETDGTYEQADSLKTAFDGAPATGFDVFHHSLDVVGQHPGIVARQQGRAGLSQTCQECPVVTTCGGGLYAHRYRTGTGFANPSVYCPDLLQLITYIRDRLPLAAAGAAGIETHAMTASNFRAVAAGFGDGEAVEQLVQSQRSLRRTLLGAVYQAASTSAVPDAVMADVRAAWSLLTTIDQEQPQALSALLSHPYLRVWAEQCLEELRDPATRGANGEETRAERNLAADLGHLSAIAASAAVRAGASACVTVPVRKGAVHLPTLGRLALGCSPETAAIETAAIETAAIEVTDDAITIKAGADWWKLTLADLLAGQPCAVPRSGNGRSAHWQPVRLLQAPGISVALDDIDPYRNCHQWQPTARLTDSDFGRWQRHFRDAWQLIQDDYKIYAPALAAGLAALMPLSAGPEGRAVSAAARDAFGAVAAALPDDPVTLALLLIHEFQHVKLGAILDLYHLYDHADTRLFHAPWREDPRPLEGLLQGTYAHLAVTDFWRVRREAGAGASSATAGQRFAHWHASTCAAIDTLEGSGSLTPLGMEFVDAMRHSAALTLAEPR